jgi:alcohol dehydrogenase class IV
MRGDWLFPTEIRFGAGRVAELGDLCLKLGITRPLIVTDRGLAGTPIFEQTRRAAARPEVLAQAFTEVQENPTGANVEAGVAAFSAARADGVVALGGGSAIDCAKAIALVAGAGGPLWRFAWTDNEAAARERGAWPLIAVSTTAGTGAEVEPSAIITDAGRPAKRAILHPAMLPRLVIADPALTVGLPPHLTAATGMDALSHNLEALCVTSYHPMADAIAIAGIGLVGRWLPAALAEPGNLEARGHMMAAAIMGATAFGKGLGAMHALSHAVGALKGHHHGLINAILMPFVLTYNRAAVARPVASLAQALRLEGDTFSAVHQWILDLRRRIGIPATLGPLARAPGLRRDRNAGGRRHLRRDQSGAGQRRRAAQHPGSCRLTFAPYLQDPP